MSAQGAFKITEDFETQLSLYTGAPHVVAVDNCSNALFLALTFHEANGREITLPSHTYPSVPCEVIHAGGRVRFSDNLPGEHAPYLTGPYQLAPLPVWDCALRFQRGMYVAGQTQCLSFTGPYKHLKLGKGGAILCDNADEAAWYKRARFSGRRECSYLEDDLDMLGWNFYLLPEIAARGLMLLKGFIDDPVSKSDLRLPFPDLRRFPVYR